VRIWFVWVYYIELCEGCASLDEVGQASYAFHRSHQVLYLAIFSLSELMGIVLEYWTFEENVVACLHRFTALPGLVLIWDKFSVVASYMRMTRPALYESGGPLTKQDSSRLRVESQIWPGLRR